MKSISAQLCRGAKLAATVLLVFLLPPAMHGQAASARVHAETQMRSHIYIYDLRDGSTHLVYTADSIWEAPNWSPDGKYLISNSKGGIYKLVLQADDTATPEKLAIPGDYRCNNDKGLSPDGTKLAFSASRDGDHGSEVYLSNADGTGIRQMTHVPPSYFHGWSPDGKTLAFVAQRNGSQQFDIYGMPAAGGPETRYTMNPHHDDGPDYSPDGKWIYINSNRSGKEAVWRFPAAGAGPNDAKAQMVVSDDREDWFPHISPDGEKMVYIGYPSGTPTHDPRNVQIEIRMATISHGTVSTTHKTLVTAMGGQGTFNVNSWAPDSQRFAYVTFEPLK